MKEPEFRKFLRDAYGLTPAEINQAVSHAIAKVTD